MRAAVRAGDVLAAPTVGTWDPAVAPGGALQPGMVLGTLWRAGRPLAVTAPTAVSGWAARVAPAGEWVAYGAPLVTMGQGALAEPGPPEPEAGADARPAGVSAVRADTDGTAYLSPQPGSPPFAPVGTAVSHHQTLALVEVMKTFSPVRSPVSGVVERVLVDDGGPVSAGVTLFWVRADVG